jgi:hypothetical protein
MSQAVSVLENVDAPDEWAVVDADSLDNTALDAEKVLAHEDGAQIALYREPAGTGLRVALPNGEYHQFKPDVGNPESIIERITTKYSSAVEIDGELSEEESRFTYYGVVNPYCHEPIPFCRVGGDTAVFDRARKAAVISERLQHNYDNPEIRVVQLDRTELKELQD